MTTLRFHQGVVETIQDVEPIIEHNKKLQSIPQKSDWGRHVAHIPNIFITKWLNEAWERGQKITRLFSPEMDEIIEQKLRDPDYKFLRVDR